MVQVNGQAVGPIRIIVHRLFPGRLPGLDKRLARWAENRHRLGRFYKAKAIGPGLRSNRNVRANGPAIYTAKANGLAIYIAQAIGLGLRSNRNVRANGPTICHTHIQT